MKRINANILTLLAACIVLQALTCSAVAASSNFNAISGKWARTDGNYTLVIKDATPDGTVDVGYFNPNTIHVAESNITIQGNYVKLFVKLQDEGYPGSTYTLYYYNEKDALVGFYYQAAMNQTFEVVFLRDGLMQE